jgi:general secretion pathway protein G
MKKDLKTHMGGFTLFELMIGVAIVGILASIATPNYIKFREKARVELTITEMRFIEKEIMNYLIDNGELPEDLSAVGMDDILDPWGRPYNYLRISESDESEEDEAQDNNGKKDDNGNNGKKDDNGNDGKKDDNGNNGKKDDNGNKGQARKDHSLHPINSDYDLFSVGKDGKSTAALTAKISQDDIVRANNGGYVGLVSNY